MNFFTLLHLVLFLSSCVVLGFTWKLQEKAKTLRERCEKEIDERVQEIMTIGYVRGIAAERARRNKSDARSMEN